MGVSNNEGTPKLMVKIMENPIKMDDLGGIRIFGNTHICIFLYVYMYIYIYSHFAFSRKQHFCLMFVDK